jgi:glycosyltransferase involved in cell wall biosynthesis
LLLAISELSVKLALLPSMRDEFELTGRLITALKNFMARNLPLALIEPTHPLATICIDAKGSLDAWYGCILALHEAGLDRQANFVLIDDGTIEESSFVATQISGLRCERVSPGQNLLSGRNRAAEAARGDIVAFLAPDIRVTETWLALILRTFAENSGAVIVGSKILLEDGSLHHQGFIFDERGEPHEMERTENGGPPTDGLVLDVDGFSDYAVAIRREDFLRLGGFDTALSTGQSAVIDLCVRVRLAGRAVLRQPLSVVYLMCIADSGHQRIARSQSVPEEDKVLLQHRWLCAGGRANAALSRQSFCGRAFIIDSNTPRPDHDAGSIMTSELMNILRLIGYHVIFGQVSAHYDTDYIGYLQCRGIDTIQSTGNNSISEYLNKYGRYVHLVIIFRYENFGLLKERIATLAPQARIIFVPADLHYLREQRGALIKRGRASRNIEEIRKQEIKGVEESDVTILHSDFEVTQLKSKVEGKKLKLLRWIVRTRSPKQRFCQRSGLCFIGSFRHPPNEDAVLWFVEEILPLVLRKAPAIQFHLVGSGMPPSLRGLASAHILVHGWVRDIIPILDGVRVFVAPLRYGAGLKGKVINSLAHGLPVVGTPTAFEGTGLRAGDGLACASSPEKFAEAVLDLHGDEDYWTRMSERAIKRCEALYSEATALETFRRLLQELSLAAGEAPNRCGGDVRSGRR